MLTIVRRPAYWLVAASACVLLLVGVSAQAGSIVMRSELTRELNGILRVAEPLHKSLVAQDEERAEIAVRDLIQQLDIARRFTVYAKIHERGHLLRILDGAKDQFELSQSTYGEERRERLEEGFNQLVNLVRIYRLEPEYGIFFCAKDRASWVQKGWKAQNPFRPEVLRDCGIRAPN